MAGHRLLDERHATQPWRGGARDNRVQIVPTDGPYGGDHGGSALGPIKQAAEKERRPADHVGLGQIGTSRDELLRDGYGATRTADVQCGFEVWAAHHIKAGAGVNKQLGALGMSLHDSEKKRSLVGCCQVRARPHLC